MGKFGEGPGLCRYILWEAEEQGLLLPYACRMGCCTACAVRIKAGEMYQPQVSPPETCGHPHLCWSTAEPEVLLSLAQHRCCPALPVLRGPPYIPVDGILVSPGWLLSPICCLLNAGVSFSLVTANMIY